MSLRIAHLGDLHIRDGVHADDVRGCLEWAADTIAEREVDVVLIPGDVFEHKSSPAERELFRGWLRYLRCQTAAPVIICRGNHDAPADLLVWELADGVTVLERPVLATIYRGRDDRLMVYHRGDEVVGLMSRPVCDLLVVPWPEKAHLAAAGFANEANEGAGNAALEHLIRIMAATRPGSGTEGNLPGWPLVGMGHLSVTGAITSSAQPLIGREIQVTAGTLADTGAAYWALNHIHYHQGIGPGCVYAGTLTGHDHGETETKGIILVEIGDGGVASWEFLPSPARRWVTVEAEVRDGMGRELTGGAPIDGQNVRYRYRCTAEEQHLFDHAAIERRFAGAHTLKIVPVVERIERVRAADVAEATTPAEKLEAWGRATETTIPTTALDKLEALQAAR